MGRRPIAAAKNLRDNGCEPAATGGCDSRNVEAANMFSLGERVPNRCRDRPHSCDHPVDKLARAALDWY